MKNSDSSIKIMKIRELNYYLRPDLKRIECLSSPQILRKFVSQVSTIVHKSCFNLFVTVVTISKLLHEAFYIELQCVLFQANSPYSTTPCDCQQEVSAAFLFKADHKEVTTKYVPL